MLDMKKAPYGTATPGALLKPTKIIGKDVFIISENFQNVKSGLKKDKQSELFGWEGPVPGSATDIANRNREAEKKKELQKSEELMEEMKSDFPQLKNIYEILKGAK